MTERTLVHAIVCAYARDELPTSWLQVHRRFEHETRRSGLRVRVRLEPLDDLPAQHEVVVVPPELAAAAREAAPSARVITATREDCARVAKDLIAELERGDALYAERASPGEPIVVVHRGPEIL